MYSDKDNFSIIYKILKTYKKKKYIYLNNNGSSVRDFIHSKDVAKIYAKLLKSKIVGTVDIGQGYGIEIKNIITNLGKKNFNIKNQKKIEEKYSIANNVGWSKKININFLKLESYLNQKLRLKNAIKLKRINKNEIILNKSDIQGTIIYGCGNAGKQIHDSIVKNNNKGVYCFVDDDPNKLNTKYKNKKIISFRQLQDLSSNYIINSIIIAIPSLTEDKIKKIFKKLYKISKNVYNLPIKKEYDSDTINLQDIQNSEFIHIFNRQNKYNVYPKLKNLRNKNILITGAGGSIGSELLVQLSRISKKKIVCLDHSELSLYNLKKNLEINTTKVKFILGSITDYKFIENVINKENIDQIYHAAAYKHLNFLENNIIPAVKNNIFGTLNIIEGIKNSKKYIKMINISTDKAAKPKSILGITKRIAEIVCEKYKEKSKNKFDISNVRFGNVFASQGSAINLFLEKINSNQNIEITDKKVERFFMSTKEACNLVIQASQFKGSFKTYILDMGKPVKIYNLIKKIIYLKKTKNKNINSKIKVIGLGKGEKIKEILSINKKIKKTKIKNILETNELKYSNKDINLMINDLQLNLEINNKNKITKIMKTFLSKEIY